MRARSASNVSSAASLNSGSRIGHGRSDLRPIFRLESLQGGGKEIAIFLHDVAPLVLYEIANDGMHILPKQFAIRENIVDRMSDAAQKVGPLLVFASEITDLRSRTGIANFQLVEDQVFLRMVVNLRVKFEVADNRADNLIVGAVAPIENLKFPLKDGEQFLDIAVLLA